MAEIDEFDKLLKERKEVRNFKKNYYKKILKNFYGKIRETDYAHYCLTMDEKKVISKREKIPLRFSCTAQALQTKVGWFSSSEYYSWKRTKEAIEEAEKIKEEVQSIFNFLSSCILQIEILPFFKDSAAPLESIILALNQMIPVIDFWNNYFPYENILDCSSNEINSNKERINQKRLFYEEHEEVIFSIILYHCSLFRSSEWHGEQILEAFAEINKMEIHPALIYAIIKIIDYFKPMIIDSLTNKKGDELFNNPSQKRVTLDDIKKLIQKKFVYKTKLIEDDFTRTIKNTKELLRALKSWGEILEIQLQLLKTNNSKNFQEMKEALEKSLNDELEKTKKKNKPNEALQKKLAAWKKEFEAQLDDLEAKKDEDFKDKKEDLKKILQTKRDKFYDRINNVDILDALEKRKEELLGKNGKITEWNVELIEDIDNVWYNYSTQNGRVLSTSVENIIFDICEDLTSIAHDPIICDKTIAEGIQRRRIFLEILGTVYRNILLRDKRHNKPELSKAFWRLVFGPAYSWAKYELYRAITMNNSGDLSQFSIMRLIFSFLIINIKMTFSNFKIRKRALEIMFDALEEHGLWGNDRPILLGNTRTFILTSFEAITPLLELDNEYATLELEKYLKEIKQFYEWAELTLRTTHDEKDQVVQLGWFPEGKRSKEPESWFSAVVLYFIKTYCITLSKRIRTLALEAFDSRKVSEGNWYKVLDSYSAKPTLSNLFSKETGEYWSCIFFGPPGTGKTTIAKEFTYEQSKRSKIYSQEQLWDFIQLTPGEFFASGEEDTVDRIRYYFNRLFQISNAVVFFDEIDDLMQSRETTKSSWDKRSQFSTTLLPKFQDLHDLKKVKFIIATNYIERVDSAIKRAGRVDFVIPLGHPTPYSRLNLLYNILYNIDKERKDLEINFEKEIDYDKEFKLNEEVFPEEVKDNKDITKTFPETVVDYFLGTTSFMSITKIIDSIKYGSEFIENNKKEESKIELQDVIFDIIKNIQKDKFSYSYQSKDDDRWVEIRRNWKKIDISFVEFYFVLSATNEIKENHPLYLLRHIFKDPLLAYLDQKQEDNRSDYISECKLTRESCRPNLQLGDFCEITYFNEFNNVENYNQSDNYLKELKEDRNECFGEPPDIEDRIIKLKLKNNVKPIFKEMVIAFFKTKRVSLLIKENKNLKKDYIEENLNGVFDSLKQLLLEIINYDKDNENNSNTSRTIESFFDEEESKLKDWRSLLIGFADDFALIRKELETNEGETNEKLTKLMKFLTNIEKEIRKLYIDSPE